MTRGMEWTWMFKDDVGYYQNKVVRIDNVDFVLSTLWSHMPPEDEYVVLKRLNDFYQTMYDGHHIRVDIYILKFRLKKEMRSKVNNHLPC